MIRIQAKNSAGNYSINIGENISDKLSHLVKKELKDNRLFLIFDANLYALHGQAIRKAIRVKNSHVEEFILPSGEKNKSQKVLTGLYDFLINKSITRSDLIIAVGGGVTSDIVGFAAATILRSVHWAVLPTTLLSMVDASIGGKTGFNHSLGKNLIGAFWPPKFVHADINYLGTLNNRELIAGMGEIIKAAGLTGGSLLKLTNKALMNHCIPAGKDLITLVSKSAIYKASIVSRDEREAGLRQVLNFGHTFAHGIESSLGYGRLLHGEAVILGIYAALELGQLLGFNSSGLNAYKGIITRMISYIPCRKIDLVSTLEGMKNDKKRKSGKLNFVLLERVGRPIITDRVDLRQVRKSLKAMIDIYNVQGGQFV